MTEVSAEQRGDFSPPGTRPLQFQESYRRYLAESDSDSFERFYRSTRELFYSYAAEKCAAAGGDVDPQEVVHRLYETLVTYAAMRRRVPVGALLSWCLGTIANLVHAERRANTRPLPLPGGALRRAHAADPLEMLIEAEERKGRRKLYDRILELIHRPNGLLTPREREILRLFYCEGKSLRFVGEACGIKSDHVAVLLHRARRKIAARFTRDGREKERTVKTPGASAPGPRCGTPPALSPASGP